jgi:ABC-type lipoprotein export system ATPase subunit
VQATKKKVQKKKVQQHVFDVYSYTERHKQQVCAKSEKVNEWSLNVLGAVELRRVGVVVENVNVHVSRTVRERVELRDAIVVRSSHKQQVGSVGHLRSAERPF